MNESKVTDRLANLSPAKRALLELKLKQRGATLPSEKSIPRRANRGAAPLSFAQQRLWFLSQLEPESYAYNQAGALRLGGALSQEALQSALNQIVARHEILRTRIIDSDGIPQQIVDASPEVEFPVIDLQSLPESEREPAARRIFDETSRRPFDLARDYTLRVSLLRLSDREHILLTVHHHVASDGWSSSIFWREFAAFYQAALSGEPCLLPELPIQYADYAAWQREWLRGERLDSLLLYWKKKLADAPALQLPTDRPRGESQNYQGSKHSWIVPKALAGRLKALSREEGATLFMTVLAAFKTLLYRQTGQEDIVVGTDVANRIRVETEKLIGFFVNLLALRTDLSGNPGFRELLGRVRETTLEAYSRQELPFDKLIEVLRPERAGTQSPFVRALCVHQNVPGRAFRFGDLAVTPMEYGNETSKFDLGVFLRERDTELIFSWVYRTDVFDHATVARMSEQFQTLLESIVSDPDTRLRDLGIISKAENQRGIEETMERRQSSLNRFKKVVPNSIDLARVDVVKKDYLRLGETQPLLIQPCRDDVDLISWAEGNRDLIETQLSKHGAILFRGFQVTAVPQFEHFASTLCPELFGEYEDLPRAAAGDAVYESTPYPADQSILFHNESSHLHRWPLKQWFFCLQPALEGGETPIVDCRKVYQLHDLKLMNRFEEKKIMYVRNFTDGLDVSWQHFFKSNSRSTVESFCKNARMDFEWKDDNGLRTRQVCPAVATHPKTGAYVWFNQIQHWHPACLDPATRDSLFSLFAEVDLPRNCYYGDGSPIEDSVMEEVNEAYRKTAVSFSWRQGDILMIDNMLTAHARNPYKGPRRIVVAMGEMIHRDRVVS